ncbi:hypothetical protein RHGRI_020197 [Rhododendron griersonianum]|uniref:Uncharacterized protein n=1 Tax=Rhododendron griersonianum TaxID=479676 RepID=A0AAV6JFL6_9ERIC|nr:hypothetical protein RHGRI_020197 [Rhododendron griersonianum]
MSKANKALEAEAQSSDSDQEMTLIGTHFFPEKKVPNSGGRRQDRQVVRRGSNVREAWEGEYGEGSPRQRRRRRRATVRLDGVREQATVTGVREGENRGEG